MFDDQQNKQATPPQNLPTEPDDMFADVAPEIDATGAKTPPNALKAGLLKPRSEETTVKTMPGGPNSEEVATPVAYTTKAPVLGKVIIVIVIIAAVLGLGYGGYWVYGKYIKKNVALVPVESPTPEPIPAVTETTTILPKPVVATNTQAATSSDITKATNDNILFGQQTDSDQDGLSDIEEVNTYQTNPQNPDSDSDGLTDGEEVRVHRTNPIVADTDSDGLNDGAEAKQWKTDPNNPDSDGDGFSDGREVANRYDPLGPGKLRPATTTPQSTTTLAPAPQPTPSPAPSPTPAPSPAPSASQY